MPQSESQRVERGPLVECPSHSTEQRVLVPSLLVSVRLLVRPTKDLFIPHLYLSFLSNCNFYY